MGNVTVFSDDFEAGNLTAWTSAGAVWSAQNSVVKNGSYSCRGASGTGVLQKTLPETGGKCYMRFWVRASSTALYTQIMLITPLGYMLVPIELKSGHFKYINGDYSELNLPTDKTFVANTWYYVEVAFDFSTHTMSWTIDGTNHGSANMEDVGGQGYLSGSDAFNDLQITRAGTGTTVYLDDFLIEKESSGSLVFRPRAAAQGLLVR